jgi:hypothetical protein
MVLAAFLLLPAFGLWAQISDFGPAEPYVVRKGDSAASIARRFYGKSSLGAKLWEANKNLVANPRRLTAGDTIYLFPESALLAGKATAVPPPPQEKAPDLYDLGQPLRASYPKYFTFLADGRGLGEAGSVRVKTRKADPISGEVSEGLFEVREVGEIVASSEHGGMYYRDGAERAQKAGKTYLSTNDEIIVRFSEDLAKILDSETYGQSDPYFREFAIYGPSYQNREPGQGRVDRGLVTGELYRYKGVCTVVARVDGLAPIPEPVATKLKRRKSVAKNQGVEPVSYVARINYVVDAVELTDQIFVFIPLEPGPERQLEPPYVEPPDSYVSLGG